MSRFFNVLFGVFLLGVFSCSSSSSSSDSDSDSGTTSTVVDDLDTVNNDLAPASLDYTQNTASVNSAQLRASHTLFVEGDSERGDPCAESDDLFDCQPVLLQLYIELAQSMIETVKTVVEEVGVAMGTVSDGSSGTTTLDSMTVEYNKTSATDFSILIGSGETSVGYVDVNNTEYLIQMNLEQILSDEAGSAPEKMEASVSYTDDATWSITTFMTGFPCDDDDARAPERIYITVSKENGLWSGKAMFYNGRWLYSEGDPDCTVEESDELSMNFYTDFVGNDAAAKASVYMMSRTQDSLDDIASFGMDNLSENFPSVSDDTSAYINPFCNPANTIDALWDDDCSSLDTTVGAADFGSASDWVVPSEFYQQEINLPESL